MAELQLQLQNQLQLELCQMGCSISSSTNTKLRELELFLEVFRWSSGSGLGAARPNGAELDDAAAARSVECGGSDMRVVCVAGFRHGRPSVRLYGVLQYSTAMMRLGACVPKSRVETKALFFWFLWDRSSSMCCSYQQLSSCS